jgi:hypothetical protein
MSNTPIVFTDFVEAMGMFDIVMEKPAEVSRGDGCG